MANTSILSAFERMWQHITTALGKKADKTQLNEKVTKVPIWENANASSKFSAQTINLPVENYDAIEIAYYYFADNTVMRHVFTTGELCVKHISECPLIGKLQSYNIIIGTGDYTTTYTINTNSIDFSDVGDPEYNIPITIYGIKYGQIT